MMFALSYLLLLFANIESSIGVKVLRKTSVALRTAVEHFNGGGLDTERAIQEMLRSTEMSLSMIETFNPEEQPSDCLNCGGSPIPVSSENLRAVDSESSSGTTITFFILLTLCGVMAVLWVARRRRRVSDTGSEVFLPYV